MHYLIESRMSMLKRRNLLSAILMGNLLLPAMASAVGPGLQFSVNTTADTSDASVGNGLCADAQGRCSLRAAIEEVNAAPSIGGEIRLGNETYTLTQAMAGLTGLELRAPVRLLPATDTDRPIIAKAGALAQLQILRVKADVTASIEGITVTLGKLTDSSGGLYRAAGIQVEPGAVLDLVGAAVNKNQGGGDTAGGVYNAGILRAKETTFAENVGVNGGALGNTGFAELTGSSLHHNTASFGGAIVTEDTNRPTFYVGGKSYTPMTRLISSSVYANKASQRGSAIFANNGLVELLFSAVTENLFTGTSTEPRDTAGIVLATKARVSLNTSVDLSYRPDTQLGGKIFQESCDGCHTGTQGAQGFLEHGDFLNFLGTDHPRAERPSNYFNQTTGQPYAWSFESLAGAINWMYTRFQVPAPPRDPICAEHCDEDIAAFLLTAWRESYSPYSGLTLRGSIIVRNKANNDFQNCFVETGSVASLYSGDSKNVIGFGCVDSNAPIIRFNKDIGPLNTWSTTRTVQDESSAQALVIDLPVNAAGRQAAPGISFPTKQGVGLTTLSFQGLREYEERYDLLQCHSSSCDFGQETFNKLAVDVVGMAREREFFSSFTAHSMGPWRYKPELVGVQLTNIAPRISAIPFSAPVQVGTSVTMDASATQDSDNGPGPLTFEWWLQVENGPKTLVSTQAVFNFVPSVVGHHLFEVRASDGEAQSRGFLVNFAAVAVEGRNITNRLEAETNDGQSGLQFESTLDTGGGQNAGFIDNGDWVEWVVNIPATGDYTVTTRNATWGNASLELWVDGASRSTLALTPAWTGGANQYQTWRSFTSARITNLTAGSHRLRVRFTSGNQNLNWVKIDPVPTTPARDISSKLEAEANDGMSGLQFESTADTGGGQNAGFIDSGDWVEWSINVPSAGNYTVTTRSATWGPASLEVWVDGTSQTTLGLTANWTSGANQYQSWKDFVTAPVALTAGQHKLRVRFTSGNQNLNYVRVQPAQPVQPTFPSYLIQAESQNHAGTQTETTSDTGGGLNVGWIDTGDKLYFPLFSTMPATFSSLPAGTYRIEYRVASQNGGALRLDQIPLSAADFTLGTLQIAATGGWQSWTTVSHDFTWNGGNFNPAIIATAGGWNINWFRITQLQ